MKHFLFYQFILNSGTITTEMAHATPPCGAISFMSEMAVSSASAALSNHFPFTPEISGIGMDASALNSTFPSDAANSGLQLGSDCLEQSRDTMRSLGQFWNFSLSELTADLTNLAGSFLLDLTIQIYDCIFGNIFSHQ